MKAKNRQKMKIGRNEDDKNNKLLLKLSENKTYLEFIQERINYYLNKLEKSVNKKVSVIYCPELHHKRISLFCEIIIKKDSIENNIKNDTILCLQEEKYIFEILSSLKNKIAEDFLFSYQIAKIEKSYYFFLDDIIKR